MLTSARPGVSESYMHETAIKSPTFAGFPSATKQPIEEDFGRSPNADLDKEKEKDEGREVDEDTSRTTTVSTGMQLENGIVVEAEEDSLPPILNTPLGGSVLHTVLPAREAPPSPLVPTHPPSTPPPDPVAPQRNLLGVLRMALTMPSPSNHPQTASRGTSTSANLYRGPTIYGRTKEDLANADGPVPIVWSVQLPPLLQQPLGVAESAGEKRLLVRNSAGARPVGPGAAASFEPPKAAAMLPWYTGTYSEENAAPQQFEVDIPETIVTARMSAANDSASEGDSYSFSRYSLASSRTASTDYGIYARRMALSQETITTAFTYTRDLQDDVYSDEYGEDENDDSIFDLYL